MREYERKTREWLFIISRAYMGWPRPLNAWLYPDIGGWDDNGQGDNLIPALIAFYRNPLLFITREKKFEFQNMLASHISGPWYFDWSDPIIVVAERRPIEVITRTGLVTDFENIAPEMAKE